MIRLWRAVTRLGGYDKVFFVVLSVMTTVFASMTMYLNHAKSTIYISKIV